MTTTPLRSLLLAASLAAAACHGGSGPGGSSANVELKSDDDKTLYALGLMLGRNVAPFGLSAGELRLVEAGMADSVNGAKPRVEVQTYGPMIGELARKRQGANAQKEKDKNKPFLEAAAKEPGATKLPSGLVIRTLKEGSGPSPQATDTVKVHYHGTLPDGTVFDSSVQRGQPATFPLNGVIPCWTEGLQKMKVGEKAKLTCPSDIAYGDRGHPPKIPGGATLTFEVELLSIEPKPTGAPPVPGMMPHAPPPSGRATPKP